MSVVSTDLQSQFVKVHLHYGDNRTKLVRFKIYKETFYID
jgi:hypothetical protein